MQNYPNNYYSSQDMSLRKQIPSYPPVIENQQFMRNPVMDQPIPYENLKYFNQGAVPIQNSVNFQPSYPIQSQPSNPNREDVSFYLQSFESYFQQQGKLFFLNYFFIK